MSRASAHQQAIRWQHFLQCPIANTNIDNQEQYYRDRESHLRHTGQARAKKLMHKLLWGLFHGVWKLCCDEHHQLSTSKVSKTHLRSPQPSPCMLSCAPQYPTCHPISPLLFMTIKAQLDTGTCKIKESLAHAEPLMQQGRSRRGSDCLHPT